MRLDRPRPNPSLHGGLTVLRSKVITSSTAGVRRAGSAALDLCYLAQGSIDAFGELVLNPWDFAAGLVILREAGGVATWLDGSPMNLEAGRAGLQPTHRPSSTRWGAQSPRKVGSPRRGHPPDGRPGTSGRPKTRGPRGIIAPQASET